MPENCAACGRYVPGNAKPRADGFYYHDTCNRRVMTVNALRAALDNIEARFGNAPVTIWLPGSRIDLGGLITVRPGADGEILIEGNVRVGSALDDITERPENRALQSG